ncbi:hypothetical protein MMSR116_29355 [Methylobacterium mesophilicum SR1.6/6]|uniref:Uncharacterized protein n=1 Tax=Methylobacterium mesophilicum SR1.6/6 TaxID=908290 RepID=A0A6B9FZ61_9HYPH|nr:hypothetical protein [Methylobacterium mesophilicum]QGY05544.1 hypothetical protein MMSR116_29355 [Methylobacterium mesophilicum SR1.6/6]
MATDDEPDVSLSERDLRALAMELALQLPRNEKDAQHVLDLMRVGYDYFLCEMDKPKQIGKIVKGRFRR